MNKLIIIDGNAILHRAYHALPSSLTTSNGKPINAVYGFVSILLRIVQDLKPTHLVVAFDTPVETLRKSQFVGYQANRPRLHSDLSSQFEITYKVLESMKIPIVKKERYEADDVIGTITSNFKNKVDEINIITGDKDILQLVSDKDKVFVSMPTQGLNNAKLYKEKDVIERLGVKPSQITDYKGLAGDSSDNYPGVPGIGPKSAVTLLEKYNTIENIYKNISDIKGNLVKKLAEGAESAVMSKSLATIVKDVPIDFNLDSSSKFDLKSDEVLKCFKEIGFKTLTNRVQQMSLL